MTIDPQAQAVLDDIARAGEGRPEPASDVEALRQARADTDSLVRFSGTMPAVAIDRRAVTGRHGSIPVEIYRPDGADGGLLVWFHGGGAIAGSLHTHRTPLAQLAEATGWAIASVGYRLAPEHRFPVQHEDCLDALQALAPDAERLVVGGDSIGGLFATTVARLARDAGSSAIEAQILLYPNTDMRQDRAFASLDENEGLVMTRKSLAFEADHYIPAYEDRASGLGSPLLARDLVGLPPALVVTCEADPLRDEGRAYARALAEAGVAVRVEEMAGMIHAVLQMGGAIDRAAELRATIAAFLADLQAHPARGAACDEAGIGARDRL